MTSHRQLLAAAAATTLLCANALAQAPAPPAATAAPAAGTEQGDRIGDVSLAAAKRLGMVRAGVVDAEVTVVAAPAAKKS